MQPHQPQDDPSGALQPQGSSATPPRADRDAAAKIMREQIDRIYNQSDQQTPGRDTSQVVTPRDNPYERVHDDNAAHQGVVESEWQRYHTAWQQYYQQYYERYYLQQVHKHRARHETNQPANTNQAFPLESTDPAVTAVDDAITKDQAVHDIRNELFAKIKHHSAKAKQNRHFLPIVSAIAVMLVFMVLQYNRIVVAQVKSYVSPGAISPQNIILDPNEAVNVGPEPKLIIPKINVDAPVVYGVPSLAEATVQNALRDGVVHYPIPGANSLPGQKGNNVIIGHSSNDVFDNGNYKFVFVQLDKLEPGDTFYIHYEGLRYTYSVTKKEVISPTEINKLRLPADKPVVTLITCTPIGTAINRLIVYADQVSPDPDTASTTTDGTGAEDEAAPLPGYSPTFLERIFGR